MLPRESSSWSNHDIAEGSTSTEAGAFRTLEENIYKNERKKKFYPLDKGDSKLEVYGENPHVVVNTIDTESAAIWLSLYDGTLLDLIKDNDDKQKITNLLDKYFSRGNLPVIPILRVDEDSPLKYRVMKDKSRVYSVYGGANINSFLNYGTETEPFYPDEFIDETYVSLAIKISKYGIDIPLNVVESDDRFSICNQYLQIQQSVKEKLANSKNESKDLRTLVLKLELFTKLFVLLEIMTFLGVNHGHPHSANWVITWSRNVLSQSDLEKELVNTSVLSTSFPEAIEAYPDCELNPFLIDFDIAKISENDGLYDEQKLLDFLYGKDDLHKVMAINLLSFNSLPKKFLVSLLDENIQFLELVIKKASGLIYEKKLDNQSLSIIKVLLEAGLDLKSENMKKLLQLITPGHISYDFNILAWKAWVSFFVENPDLLSLKKTFFNQAAKSSGYEQDKRGYLNLVKKLLNRNNNMLNLNIGAFFKGISVKNKSKQELENLFLDCI